MAFAKYKPISISPFWIFWVMMKLVIIKNCQYVNCAQASSRMTRLCAMHHLNNNFSQRISCLFKLLWIRDLLHLIYLFLPLVISSIFSNTPVILPAFKLFSLQNLLMLSLISCSLFLSNIGVRFLALISPIFAVNRKRFLMSFSILLSRLSICTLKSFNVCLSVLFIIPRNHRKFINYN